MDFVAGGSGRMPLSLKSKGVCFGICLYFLSHREYHLLAIDFNEENEILRYPKGMLIENAILISPKLIVLTPTILEKVLLLEIETALSNLKNNISVVGREVYNSLGKTIHF